MYLDNSADPALYKGSFAPKVLLSSRRQIESPHAGLILLEGARKIISDIRSRRTITKLILGHNDLQDDGCIALFDFLCSPDGRRHAITEISLNSNRIGDRGLLAISAYLQDNTTLRELFIQNNAFTDVSTTISTFTSALNSSRLSTLSLATNPLSDDFLVSFLSVLNAPYLRDLHLSAVGLTARSGPLLAAYIESPRCRLHILRANGNHMGAKAVGDIIGAARRGNFSLIKLEMYANWTDDDHAEDGDGWKARERELRSVLLRNDQLKRETERTALSLLRYARTLLLRRNLTSTSTAINALKLCSDSGSCSCIQERLPPNRTTLITPMDVTYELSSSPPASYFLFRRLPTELQLHVLSFLAPTLSSMQRIRIYTYASSMATLPRLLCLPGRCIPDPGALPFGSTGMTGKGGVGAGGCANGKCLGAGNSLLCRREEERTQWLADIGCNSFERDQGDGGSQETLLCIS